MKVRGWNIWGWKSRGWKCKDETARMKCHAARTNIISWGQVIQTPSQYSNDCGFLEQSVDVVLHRRTVYSLIPQKSFVSWLTPWRKDKETEYFYWLCFWIFTNKIPAVKLIQLTLQLWTLNSAIEQSTHYIVYTKSYNLRLWKCYLAFYHKIF